MRHGNAEPHGHETGRRWVRTRVRILAVLLALAAMLFGWPAKVLAGGPRYVTGPPFFTATAGQPIGWQQQNLLYFTDPGDLSANVNHAAADALVAAAAGVWNVPVASITVGKGGALAEHVSGANVYLGTSGTGSTAMVYPADVSSANAAAIPLAILYDTDGSVTDTLLGAGASSPSSCRQNAVTESVDLFDPAGYIRHAIIVLNGRCTGAAAAQQLQMQYQLERIFGRVLGLAWSQANDNVFTGTPTPTYNQAVHWPIMHPLDILCGSYSYQCLPNPFTLRPDDLAGLVSVYPVSANGTPPAGKQASLADAHGAGGTIAFPTGEGMAGVNVLLTRETASTLTVEPWVETAAVTGMSFVRNGTSVLVAPDTSASGSMGSQDPGQMGRYAMAYVPLQSGVGYQDILISTEAVNPLYAGLYSLGPYAAGDVAPSGSAQAPTLTYYVGAGAAPVTNFTVADAAPACGNGLDGTPADPEAMPTGGWWNGLLCGYGHATYLAATVQPGRTFTVEATALDANGLATTTKAMPVIGVYAQTDAATALPSIAVAPAAFQSRVLGMTTLPAANPTAATGGATQQVRIGIADQRGDGRPDYAFQGRFFYADSLYPDRIPPAGGVVTITGSGFRNGNRVTINGAPAAVTDWTASQITLTAPGMSVVNATSGTGVDVVVSDTGTGASSTMSGALIYDPSATLPNQMKLVSAPFGDVPAGSVAATPFAVQLLAGDGVTPVPGQTVSFSASGVGVSWSACAAAVCPVVTDANGMAQSSVTPAAAGSVTLTATLGTLTETASFTAQAPDGVMQLLSTPGNGALVGQPAAQSFQVQVEDAHYNWLPGRLVTFTVTGGSALLSPCAQASCSVVTNGYGEASVSVTPSAAGTISLTASDGSLSQTTSFVAVTSTDVMKIAIAPSANSYINQGSGQFLIQLFHADGVSQDYYEPVTFTAPPGVLLEACRASPCVQTTNTAGVTGTGISINVPGTYTVQASFGAATVSVTVTGTVPVPVLKIVSMPDANQVVGVPTDKPFAAELVNPDGTLVLNQAITLSGAPGSVVLTACGSYAACVVFTDGSGIASSPVIPQHPGTISLSAALVPNSVTESFTALNGGETLRVVTQPAATGTFVGDAETFAVQVLATDGATPVVARNVTFAVTGGSFAFAGCGSPCVVSTDASGNASATGTALAAGSVSLQATDSATAPAATQTVSFSTSMRPDVLVLLSGPAGTIVPGVAASPAFAVQVFASDGVTPLPGHLVTITVQQGSLQLSGCTVLPCLQAADANGRVSLIVTPLAPGTSRVTLTDGAASVSDTFTVSTAADVLSVTSAPATGSYAGVAAALPFTVHVLLADGVTPAVGRSVTFTVTNGTATLGACGGASQCALTVDANGNVSSTVTPGAGGTVVLTATDGTASVTASFAAAVRANVLHLVTAPSGTVMAGSSAGTFVVQLTAGDGLTPLPGQTISFTASSAAVVFSACDGPSCSVVTDVNGNASTGVLPSAAGAVSLTASVGALTQTASFTVTARLDVLRVISVPANGSPVGSSAATAFAVQVLQGDGVTPAAGEPVTLAVTGGGALLGACGAASCTVVTDAHGLASTAVTPKVAGTVLLAAADGALSVTASFLAAPLPDLLSVASAPGTSVYVGASSAGAFAVRLVGGDGVTPAAGVAITFAGGGAGQVQFAVCGAAVCTVATDENGSASAGVVTGLAAGAVSLTATAAAAAGAQPVVAALQVVADQQSLTPASAASVYVAAGVSTSGVLGVTANENGSPATGLPVAWTAAAVVKISSASTVTDASGGSQVGVTWGVLAAGQTAQVTACAWSGVCTTFGATGVATDGLTLAIVSGGAQTVASGQTPAAVVAQLSDAAGHPVLGGVVTVSQTVSAVDWTCPAGGRCPAVTVLRSLATVAASDGNGLVSVAPLTASGAVGETETKLVISAGTGAVALGDVVIQP